MTLPISTTASTAPHFRRIAPAHFKAVYSSGVTLDRMAETFGLTRRAVYCRAKKMGLSRGHATKKPSITLKDEGLFASMWAAGIVVCDMAAYFKITSRTVANTCVRLKLPKRGNGQRPLMSMAQFFEAQLGELLAHQARLNQLSMINAEMCDKVGGHYVGAAHAKKVVTGP